MNEGFRLIKTDKITRWGLLSSSILLLISIAVTTFFYRNLPPYLPLYNRLPWGYERLGTKLELYIPMTIAFVFLLINTFISSKVYTKLPLIARLVGVINFILTLCTCIFTLKVISIVL